MAQSSWPAATYHDGAVSDTEYERLTALPGHDGLHGHPRDTPVVSADGTGRHITVRPGAYARIRGRTWSSGPTPFTVQVPANLSGQWRFDLVVLRLDRRTWRITVEVKAGTPGYPSPPTSVREDDADDAGVYEIALAEIRVAPNAAVITAADLQQRGWYLGAGGTILCTPGTRPPVSDGQYILDVEQGATLVGHAGAFVPHTSDTQWTTGVIAPGWSPSNYGDFAFRRVNGIVYAVLELARTGARLRANTDSFLGSVPAGFRPSLSRYALAYFDGAHLARVWINVYGDVTLTNYVADLGTGVTLTVDSPSWPEGVPRGGLR
ncbi:MAG TPA: hypothetical protein VF755_18405 [Catenuloplanes sp.]|jgi:hypothetical protein